MSKSNDLSKKTLANFQGSRIVFNIFPSIDTGTCATSVRTFNKSASELENTKVLCISKDLPFAQARFCGAEGIENVVMDYVHNQSTKYGIKIMLTLLQIQIIRVVIAGAMVPGAIGTI